MTKPAPQPIAQGLYKTAVRYGDTIQTSGMTPRDGNTLQHTGIVQKYSDPEQQADAVRVATRNAVTALQSCMEAGEKVTLIAHLVVYIATEAVFSKHAAVADHASRYLLDIFGDAGKGTRAAVGVASLPSDAPVEVVLTAIVGRPT
jgi:enamine deaminase RidA (YjgF/YER057c/UK114 family)